MPDALTDVFLSPLLRFGLVLLGGLASGELARRLANLPRTTGYVLFGISIGRSGTGWVDPHVLGSTQFFVYPALGLILFELGHRFPLRAQGLDRRLLLLGAAQCTAVFAAVYVLMRLLGFERDGCLFAAAIAVSTSPAITIATSSDIGADGPCTNRLFGLVALNGCVAFAAVGVIQPMFAAGAPAAPAWLEAIRHVALSLGLGAALALLTCRAARWLGPQAEHQHLLLLGAVVVGTGLPLALRMSPLLTLLAFGIGTRLADRRGDVVAIRIASDARVFLVVSFVLAGAALDLGALAGYGPAALALAGVRFGACWIALQAVGRRGGLAPRDAFFTAVGLLPMSGVALVLLGDAGPAERTLGPALAGTLMSLIVLMQLAGPLCTQAAVGAFGEARRYARRRAGFVRKVMIR